MKPDAQDLLQLADEVAALTAYDGNLMARIDCAVRFPHLRPAQPDDHPTVKDRRFDPSAIWTPTGWLMSHNYWASLDDAMELAPDELRLMVAEWDHEILRGKGPWQAILSQPGCDASFSALLGFRCENAATAAAAITAAALRARAHSTKESNHE